MFLQLLSFSLTLALIKGNLQGNLQDNLSHDVTQVSISTEGLSLVTRRSLESLTITDSVSISGIRQPISFSYDNENGNIFILQKMGIVRLCKDWVCSTPPAILDISRNVASYGDHGATSILYDNSFIYITYMKLNPVWGYDCADSGALNGRAKEDVFGCIVYGRLSRWQVSANGYVIGHEQVLFDTESNQKACVQFPTHSTPTCVVKAPNGDFLIATGDGAAYSQLDDGGLGGNACNDEDPYLGALRAQNPTRYNGKIIRLREYSFDPTIESIGHRNPFRLTVDDGKVFATETGWYTAEEINEIKPGKNYGWPCYEGVDPTPEYSELDFCERLDKVLFTPPVFSYKHPNVVAQMVASISGIAGLGNHMYYSDYSTGFVNRVDKTSFNTDTIETMMTGSFVCELKRINDVILYVDILKGIIGKVPLYPIGTPTLDETYPVPTCEIATIQLDWTPFKGYPSFGAITNIDGREGTIFTWSIALFYNFVGQDCDYTFLFTNDGLGAGLTFPAPYLSPTTHGTLEITLEVNTEKGLHAGIASATSKYYLPTKGSTLNTCTGMRTQAHLNGAPIGVYFQEGEGISNTGIAQLGVKANLPQNPPPGSLYTRPETIIDVDAQFSIWRTEPKSPWKPFADSDPWSPIESTTMPDVFSSSDVTSTSSILFAAVPLSSSKIVLANATYIWRAYIFINCISSSCGWSLLLEKTTSKPWFFLQSPQVPLPSDGSGITLLIEAIAITTLNTKSTVQQKFIPSLSSFTSGSLAAPVCDCKASLGSLYEVALSGTTLLAGTYIYEEIPIYAAFSAEQNPFTGYDYTFFTASPSPSSTSSSSPSVTTTPVYVINLASNSDETAASSNSIFTSPVFIGGMAAGAVLIAVVALIVVVVHKTAPSQVQINVAPSQIPSSQKPTQVIRNATSVSDTATAPRTRPGILSPLGAPSSKAV